MTIPPNVKYQGRFSQAYRGGKGEEKGIVVIQKASTNLNTSCNTQKQIEKMGKE